MKCLRCNKPLPAHPNSATAKYIYNPADSKTFGEAVSTEFTVKDKAKVTVFNTLDEARTVYQAKVIEKADTVIAVKKKIKTNWEKYIVEKKTKPPDLAKINALLAERSLLQDEFLILDSRYLELGGRPVMKQIPKTAVVCKKCVKPADTIIW